MIEDIKRWLSSPIVHSAISVDRAGEWLSWCMTRIEDQKRAISLLQAVVVDNDQKELASFRIASAEVQRLLAENGKLQSQCATMTEELGALRLENERLQAQVKAITAGVQMALDGSSDDDPVRLAARRGHQLFDRRCEECEHWTAVDGGLGTHRCARGGPSWMDAHDFILTVEPHGGTGCDRYEKGTP